MNPVSNHKKVIKYNRSNCGVYITDAKGVYMGEEIQQVARDHGSFAQIITKKEAEDLEEWELYQEFAEESTQYMNDYCIEKDEPIEWGWRSGDWGLWFATDEIQF
jgi:hypothetical protein